MHACLRELGEPMIPVQAYPLPGPVDTPVSADAQPKAKRPRLYGQAAAQKAAEKAHTAECVVTIMEGWLIRVEECVCTKRLKFW